MPVTLLARCPPPGLAAESASHSGLLGRLSAFVEETYGRGVDCCFGLELRAAYRLEKANAMRKVQERAPFRQILLRPAVEPILLSFAETFHQDIADAEAIDRFVSCIHGVPTTRRSGPCRITPDQLGNCVLFPDPADAAGYAQRLATQLPTLAGPINKAAYVYAEVILSHPYMDGNGRLARSLALACLAKEMDGRLPLLPLGAAFYANAQRTASALQTLAATANWPHFMQAFEALLVDGLALAEGILFGKASTEAGNTQ